MRVTSYFAFLVAVLGVCARAQNVCPNPSAEDGTFAPSNWGLAGGGGWGTPGRSGSHCLSLNAQRGAYVDWYSFPSVAQGQPYVIRFFATSTNAIGGYLIGGLGSARRDFATPQPTTAWSDYSYVAWVPSNGAPNMQLGSWDMSGTVCFDDVEILPLNPVLQAVGPYQLGDGESISAGQYVFTTQYGGYGGNYARPIYQANANFNTSRWYLDPGKWLIYRHELGGQTFSNAQVRCNILNYNGITNTTLWVEASADGQNWQFVGSMSNSATAGVFSLPSNLFPAPVVYVRLGTAAQIQFALSGYVFTSGISDTVSSGTGGTYYFGQLLGSPNVQIQSVTNTPVGQQVSLLITNSTASPQQFNVVATTYYSDSARTRSVAANVPAGSNSLVSIMLPTAGFGNNTAVLTVQDERGTNIFQQDLTFSVNILTDDSYGELLPSPENTPVWWCEGAYKVGRTRGLPLSTNVAAHITAARNEYEPFQLVLRPDSTMSNVTVSITDFVSSTNPTVSISSTNVTICRVDYVPVTQLLSAEVYSTVGDHPDPLIPLTGPFDAPGQTNSPLWFTVYAPKTAPAGLYQANVHFQWDGGAMDIPVTLKVYNFTLTDVTHTRSSYNLYVQDAWHGLLGGTDQQRAAVWELYLQDMNRHRISARFPQYFSSLNYSYNSAAGSFSYDFSACDPALERYLEEYNFTVFKDIHQLYQLPAIGALPTYTANTNAINPAYRAAYIKLMQPIAQHFRERGWLSKAFHAWIDEPEDWLMPMVSDGMHMVEEAAPDLWRRYDKQYGPSSIIGASQWSVLWEGLNVPATRERQAAGEQVWAYMAMRPPQPWPNNYIDHPAINPRVCSWFLEKMGLDGDEYWAINFYSATNPWVNTMCLIPGPSPTWMGNGDGVLVYPPVKAYPTNPIISGPIDSIRWEMKREGFEDREYFWLLKRAITVATPVLGANHPAVVEANAAYGAAMQQLVYPPAYPFEPAKIMAARDRVATALEALTDGSPFIAKDPLSKVVNPGDSVRLRVEAVGWPVPSIQWMHGGTNVPGATSYKLELSAITSDMAGAYQAVASSSSGSVTSAIGNVTVLLSNQLPVLVQQPMGLARTNGGRAVLGVGVSSLTPLSYQWFCNGTAIAGATNATLLLTNLSPNQVGNYTVAVTNATGGITSTPATLTLPPGIASQPVDQTVAVGATAQFSVTAAAAGPLNYQWYFNGTNALNGAISNVLVLSSVQLSQAGTYQVLVSNAAGSVTSLVATLTVFAPTNPTAPTITSQPTNQTVLTGQPAQFTVVCTGTAPFGYQWFFNNSNLIAGANSNVLTLANVQISDGGSYQVLITNAVGAATSAVATLTVQPPPPPTAPVITSQPTNLTIIVGQAAQFSVTATGTGPLYYQWSCAGTNLATGLNTNILTLTNVQASQGGVYQVVVSNIAGTTSSIPATLTVLTNPIVPTITSQPGNQVAIAGQAAQFGVTAWGSVPMGFQWYNGYSDGQVLAKWRTALGRLQSHQTNLVTVLCVGDETTSGYGSTQDSYNPNTLTWTAARSNSYPNLLAQLFKAAGYEANDSAFLGKGILFTLNATNIASYDPRVTIGSGWLCEYNTGRSLGGFLWYNGSTNNALTFSPQQNWDTVDVYVYTHLDPSMYGNLTIEIDGVAQTNLTTQGNFTFKTVTLTTAPGAHSVSFRRNSGNVYMLGAAVRLSTVPSVRIINAGLGGERTDNVVTENSTFGYFAAVNAIRPDVTLISFGLEETLINQSTATYQSNLLAVVTNAQSQGSVVLWTPAQIQGSSALFQSNLTAMATVASNTGSSLVDVNGILGGFVTATNAGRMADNNTPSRPGYARIAAALFGAINCATTGPVANANGSLFTLSNVPWSQAGPYYVVVTNSVGAATSTVATLTVLLPSPGAPVIVTQPTNQLVNLGQTAQFAVNAGGGNSLGYQWYFNDTNMIAGAYASILTVTNVQVSQMGRYSVQVTNESGLTISTAALLLVQNMPYYTTEPPGLSVAGQGKGLALSLAPDNRSRTVLVSSNLIDWLVLSNIPPSSSAVSIPAVDATVPVRYFRVKIGP